MLYFDVVTIDVRAGAHRYDVIVGSQLVDNAGELISARIGRRRCAIITDENIAPLFATRLQKSLSGSGIQSLVVAIPAGEQHKTFPQAGAICDRMLEHRLDRESFVIGIGGGVVGDVSGFVAAIFQRGLPHVQIPTTLLAMVDSSIGGKTGVNTAAGKNLIGAIHHPSLVIDDVETLRKLPTRELKQGYAEIIKHAIIADPEMFQSLRSADVRELERADGELISLIRRNIAIKTRLVGADEHDRSGQRALLNFGHTVGHGIERAGNYQKFLHGEAISVGMVAAANISVRRAGLSDSERFGIIELLQHFGLPTKLPAEISRQKILDSLKFDKKFQNGEVRFVVVPRIGAAHLATDITAQDIEKAVNEL